MIASERSLSVWKATAALQEFPPLRGEAEADVCVVGAGIAGMSVAYHLARAGSRVIVLDDNAVGGGETAQTTAHLFSANDDRFFMVERVHGVERARVSYASHQAAIERVAEVVTEEGIDCDLLRLDGYLFLGPEHTPDFLRRELEAAHRAGFHDAEWVDRLSAGASDLGPALRFPRQGQFHPLKYLAGLSRCVVRDGGRIHTGNHVAEIEGGSPARVRGDGFSVRAGAVVVATNTPINDRLAIHTKQAPYRTFVIAARVPAGAVPPALYWDTLEHYHYVRVQPMEDDPAHEYLVVGGEDHKTGHHDDAADRYARLEAWTRARFSVVDVVHRWSGQFIDPVDYVGFIGRDPAGMENVYVATGDSGHGMTHGTIAGMLISDLVLGRPNEWEALYDPRRKPLSRPAVQDFVYENVDVALQYTDLLPTGGDVASADQVAPGTGAILQRGAAKIAAYRDERGVLHECLANCTHLGCVVQWNSEEKSWDCPCHGSRFSPVGDVVLNGPAIAPLKPAPGAGR